MDTSLNSSVALGRALRDARRAMGLTQGRAARLAGIAQPTVSKIERGQSAVTLGTLLRILAVLKLELVVRQRRADVASPWEDEE